MIVLPCCFDKGINKFIVLLATHPGLPKTEIELVFEEFLILSWISIVDK